MSPTQERLVEPPRLERYCPAEHCSKACGATDCTCAPCLPSCPFCKARKAAGRKAKSQVRFEVEPDFTNRQLHLFGGRLERKSL